MATSASTRPAITADDIRWDSSRGPIEVERAAIERDTNALLDAAVALIPSIDSADVVILVERLALAVIASREEARSIREALHAALAVARYENFGRNHLKQRRNAVVEAQRKERA